MPDPRPLIVLAEFEEPGKLAGPLVQAGFHTETMDTADAALRYCGINPVTVVISRVVFRYGITGIELARRLQSMASPPAVVLITTYQADRLQKIPGFPIPGVPVLRKPIIAAELVKIVSAIAPSRSPS
jgi:DNA-binding response OmpR family regulator